MQAHIEVTDWEYVANPSGGFLGLWWHFLKWQEFLVYLQIEQGNLCLKIGEVYTNHSNVRNEWYLKLINKAQFLGRLEIVRPKRFGSGTYMTVAIVERRKWLGDDDSLLNKDIVIERLKEYEQFLDSCLSED